jgi:hypothetical protein
MSRKRLPSPAMVIAVLALFVALGGTAVAAGVVPLAKRALVADNAKKLGGLSPAALVAGIPGLVTVRTQAWSLNADGQSDFSVGCSAGEKAIAGGYDNPSGDALSIDNRPSADASTWKIFLVNVSTTKPASGSLYAVCLA